MALYKHIIIVPDALAVSHPKHFFILNLKFLSLIQSDDTNAYNVHGWLSWFLQVKNF